MSQSSDIRIRYNCLRSNPRWNSIEYHFHKSNSCEPASLRRSLQFRQTSKRRLSKWSSHGIFSLRRLRRPEIPRRGNDVSQLLLVLFCSSQRRKSTAGTAADRQEGDTSGPDMRTITTAQTELSPTQHPPAT